MSKRLLSWLDPRRVDALLIAVGVAIRLRQYFANVSLEVAEAELSLNLISRTFSQLLLPLDLDQAAPVGFLWIQRFLIDSFGPAEMVLRAFPTFCGIASLFMIRALVRRFLSPFATHVVVGIFAISPYLVAHSNHVKQYSSDVAVTLLLLLLAHSAMVRRRDTASVAVLGASGALALWASHPAVFVLGGIGMIWLVEMWRERTRRTFARLMLCGAPWAISFGAFYWVSLRHVAHNAFLSSYWGNAFMPLPPLSIHDLGWFHAAFLTTFRDPGGFLAPGLAGVVCVVGIFALARRDTMLLQLLTFPVMLALLASGVGRFPFAGRVILFLMPMLLILIGAGIDQISALTRSRAPEIVILLLGVMTLDPMVTGTLGFIKPRPECDARGAVAHLAKGFTPGDTIYVYSDAHSLFRYYAPRFGLGSQPFVTGTSAESNWRDDSADLDGLMGPSRVWLVFAHVHNRDGHPTEEDFFLFDLEHRGRQLSAYRTIEASVYLYDLSGPPPAAETRAAER